MVSLSEEPGPSRGHRKQSTVPSGASPPALHIRRNLSEPQSPQLEGPAVPRCSSRSQGSQGSRAVAETVHVNVPAGGTIRRSRTVASHQSPRSPSVVLPPSVLGAPTLHPLKAPSLPADLLFPALSMRTVVLESPLQGQVMAKQKEQ